MMLAVFVVAGVRVLAPTLLDARRIASSQESAYAAEPPTLRCPPSPRVVERQIKVVCS